MTINDPSRHSKEPSPRSRLEKRQITQSKAEIVQKKRRMMTQEEEDSDRSEIRLHKNLEDFAAKAGEREGGPGRAGEEDEIEQEEDIEQRDKAEDNEEERHSREIEDDAEEDIEEEEEEKEEGKEEEGAKESEDDLGAQSNTLAVSRRHRQENSDVSSKLTAQRDEAEAVGIEEEMSSRSGRSDADRGSSKSKRADMGEAIGKPFQIRTLMR